jgi:hypothetical protein
VTYKYRVYGLDTGFIQCLHHLQYFITIYSMALSLDHKYSLYSSIANSQSQSTALSLLHTDCLQVHYTHIESSWSDVLHQSSGSGFQQQTFCFLGSQTIPATLNSLCALLLFRSVLSGSLPISAFWNSIQYLLTGGLKIYLQLMSGVLPNN